MHINALMCCQPFTRQCNCRQFVVGKRSIWQTQTHGGGGEGADVDKPSTCVHIIYMQSVKA